jgi:hypothetical protein
MRSAGGTFLLCLLCVLGLSGRSTASDASRPWEASPAIVQQFSLGRFLRIEVTNTEARDVCINDVAWPGSEGTIFGDTLTVRGKHQTLWTFTGVEKYPTMEVVRLKPGARIATTVDVPRYYQSDVPCDQIIVAFWRGGFVYCSCRSAR